MDFVEQLKSSVDIVKVVGEYVRLRRAGAGPRYTGLCPFHTEKTPSFSVHQTHQFYKCFGCNAGGDVIKFIMEIERLSFYEALKLLAERNGIPMPKRPEFSDQESRLRAVLLEMHELAARAFRSNLAGAAGAGARAYLERRQVAPRLAEEFGLGYADRTGQDLIRRFEAGKYASEHLEASGLVLKRQNGGGYYDRFRDRLMFPIHGESGKIIGFGGRVLAAGGDPKYLNSPETPVYRKSSVLYNLHQARDAIRKSGCAILVEGYMDVIGLASVGVRETVASCGTALTSQQVRALKRHADQVVVNFDADAAGINAAERSIAMLLEEGMQIRVLELEGGQDPDEYVKAAGVDQYRRLLEKAPGYFQWLSDRARSRFDMRTPQGKVAALQFLLPAIQKISDRIERAAVAGEVAGRLGVETGLVLDHFRRAALGRREQKLEAPPQTVRPAEKLLLNAVLLNAEARRSIVPLLKDAPELDLLTTRGIFRALTALYESKPEFHFAELEGRLEEADRDLLSSLAFADDLGQEHCTEEQARACLERLQAEGREASRAELRRRVREAEHAGDRAEALRLVEELSALERVKS